MPHKDPEQRKEYAKQHYQANKEHKIELVKQWKEVHQHKLIEIILCACGGKHQYRTKAEHERTIKHQKYINNQIPTIVG